MLLLASMCKGCVSHNLNCPLLALYKSATCSINVAGNFYCTCTLKAPRPSAMLIRPTYSTNSAFDKLKSTFGVRSVLTWFWLPCFPFQSPVSTKAIKRQTLILNNARSCFIVRTLFKFLDSTSNHFSLNLLIFGNRPLFPSPLHFELTGKRALL